LTSGKILHIIVPCYNPDGGWDKTIVEKFSELRSSLPGTELKLTLVNDGSIKGFENRNIKYLQSEIESFHLVSYPENKGKGYALRQGIEAADGDYFIYTDIDFPYTIESMAAIYDDLQNGADVVVGIREREYYEKVPPRRVIISKMVKKLIRYLLKTQITDTQCGLKGFNNKGKEIFLKTSINRFLFDMEFVKLASGDKNTVVKPQRVFSRPGIVFSHMNYKVLLGESFNFLKLFIS